MSCNFVCHAEHVGQTDLHLLKTSSLKLASKQQLPHGCTAAALSPHSCCLASLHQPDSHIASTHPPADLQQPLSHAVNTEPDVLEPPQQEASLEDGMPTDITQDTQASANSFVAVEDRIGRKAGQKRKRQDMLQTSIVCFHSLPTDALAEQSQLLPERRELLEDAVTVKAERQAENTEAKTEMLTSRAEEQELVGMDDTGTVMQVSHTRHWTACSLDA